MGKKSGADAGVADVDIAVVVVAVAAVEVAVGVVVAVVFVVCPLLLLQQHRAATSRRGSESNSGSTDTSSVAADSRVAGRERSAPAHTQQGENDGGVYDGRTGRAAYHVSRSLVCCCEPNWRQRVSTLLFWHSFRGYDLYFTDHCVRASCSLLSRSRVHACTAQS